MKKLTLSLLCVLCAFAANATVWEIRGNFTGWGTSPDWTFEDKGNGVYELYNVTFVDNNESESKGFKLMKDGSSWYGGDANGPVNVDDASGFQEMYIWYENGANIGISKETTCKRVIFVENGYKLRLVTKETMMLRGDSYGWDGTESVFVKNEDGSYSYTENDPSKLKENFKLYIPELDRWFTFSDGLSFKLGDYSSNSREAELAYGLNDNMQITDAGNYQSITLTIKEGEKGAYSLTVAGEPKAEQNPLAGATVSVDAAPTTGGVGVTLDSEALATVEGSCLKYYLGEASDVMNDYDEAFVLSENGQSITAWVEATVDGRVCKSEAQTFYPLVLAYTQPKNEAWETTCIYMWTEAGTKLLGEWPGKEIVKTHVSGDNKFAYEAFLATGYDADKGYLYEGSSLNVIFNNNNGGEQTSDIKKIEKIYTCYSGVKGKNEGDADTTKDVTDSLGDDLSGVDAVEGEAVTVVGGQGEIRVSGAADVAVFTMSGALAGRGQNVKVPAGLYVVKADSKVTKVIVK